MPRITFVPTTGFPRRLCHFLKERGITDAQVQRDTGISRMTLRKWKRGHGYPERRALYHFCRQYQVPLAPLLYGPGEPLLELPLRVDAAYVAGTLARLYRALVDVEKDLDRLTADELDQLLGRVADLRRATSAALRQRRSDPGDASNEERRGAGVPVQELPGG